MQTSTSNDRPVFRQDLVAEAIEEQGAKFIDVMDPDTGNVFRFFEVEYSLACAMDGQRDVAGIVKWAQEELGLTPSPREVQSVIATLADLRFIETGATKLSDVPEAKAAAMSPEKSDFDEHNDATTIGTAAHRDEELAPGILVGAASHGPSGDDVELGRSGGAAPSASAREEAMPAASFDLGAPGVSASATAKPAKAPVEDIALGAPGAREAVKAPAAKAPAGDLSMDLSDHLAIKPADVKEAVRASKVMTAVEVPKDLQDELDAAEAKPADKAAAKAADKPAEKVVEKKVDKKAEKAAAKAAEKAAEKAAPQPAVKVVSQPVEKAAAKPAEKPAEKSAEKSADKKPADKAADKKPAGKAVEKKAVALPNKPAEKTSVAPPAPAQRVSPVLLVLLIVAVVGAGAFFFWRYVLDKPEAAEPTTKVVPSKPAPPPAPAEATSKVVLETPAAQDIKVAAGALETVEANDKDVKGGDVVATLDGAKGLATEIAALQKAVDAGTPAIAAAQKELADAQQKENNAAGVTAAQAKFERVKKPFDDKKATIAKKQADLDKLTVKSPGDGKLATTAKVGQKVAADEVIGKITRATVSVATFKIPPTTKIGADGNVSITAGDKTVVCTVSDAQSESIKVTCPADSGLADGADVKLKLPN